MRLPDLVIENLQVTEKLAQVRVLECSDFQFYNNQGIEFAVEEEQVREVFYAIYFKMVLVAKEGR